MTMRSAIAKFCYKSMGKDSPLWLRKGSKARTTRKHEKLEKYEEVIVVETDSKSTKMTVRKTKQGKDVDIEIPREYLQNISILTPNKENLSTKKRHELGIYQKIKEQCFGEKAAIDQMKSFRTIQQNVKSECRDSGIRITDDVGYLLNEMRGIAEYAGGIMEVEGEPEE